MRWILPTLLHILTGKPRYFPEFEWSKELWTHNIFRFFGVIFGERYGIRPNIYSWQHEGKTYEIGYTLEAQLALFEVWIRSLFKRYSIKIVPIPQYALAGLNQRQHSPYRFAIALDSYNDNGTTNSNTFNHTCTGSNLFLVGFIVGDINVTDNLTGVTYNSVAMAFATSGRFPTDRWQDIYILTGPSTGSNAMTTSGNTFNNLGAVSYTGCKQTSQPDSTNAQFVAVASTTVTATTTVVASNCWIVAHSRGGGGYTDGTGTVLGSNPWIGGDAAFHSNGIVGTGSQSITENQGSSTYEYTIISFSPAAAVSITTRPFFFTLLGVS